MAEYVRIMKLTYIGEFNDVSNIPERVQKQLHDSGLSLVSSYHYNNTFRDENYGFHMHQDEDVEFDVLIDGNKAFTLEYRSQANLAVKGLADNGYNAETRTIRNIKEYEKWHSVNGKYLGCHFEGMTGDYQTKLYPSIRYNSELTMYVEFDKSYSTWTLQFRIVYRADTISQKKKVEKMIIDVPLSDMRYIRTCVENSLTQFLEEGELDVTVDCNSSIRSEANYECSPETIGKVMNDA